MIKRVGMTFLTVMAACLPCTIIAEAAENISHVIPEQVIPEQVIPEQVIPELDACFNSAADTYDVNKNLLIAVGITESNLQPRAINKNASPVSLDIGVMQVNSFWWPLLAEQGIEPNHLFDPCTNIHVGAWILADSIKRYGNNWRAVGAYNAGTGVGEWVERRRAEYVEKVYRNYLSVSAGSVQ